MAADLATVALLLDDLPYPAHLSAVDADRTYPWVAANQAVLRLLGRERDDVVGRPLAEIIPDPDAVATMRRQRDEVAETRAPARYELAVELPSGPRRLETTLVPIRNGDGTCAHIFGVWNDATAQREVEARGRAILRATPDVIATVRRDGTLVSVDGSVLQLLNDASGMIGSRIPDLYPSEFTDRVLELIGRTLDTGELQYDEFLVDFNGVELLLEARTVPMGPDLVLGIGRDVTERKRSEDALRDSEARLRAAAESGDKGFSILEAVRDDSGEIVDFRFVEINSNGQRLLARDGVDVVGSLLTEVLPFPGIRERIARFGEVVETGKVFEHEFRSELPGLGRRWLHQQITKVGDGIAITTNDVSERKRREDELRRRIQVEQLISDVSRSLGTVSADEMDDAIVDLLARSSALLGAGAARLHRTSDDDQWSVCTHEWLSPPVATQDPQRDTRVPLQPLKTAAAEHRDYDFVRHPHELGPDLSAQRQQLKDAGVRSLVRIPMRSSGRLTGFLAFFWFDDSAERWEPLFPAFRVLGDVVEATLERTQSEEALRRSEERFRALVQHTSDVISVLDEDGRIIYASPAVGIFGWTEESLVGTNAFELVHPDDRELVVTRFVAGLVEQRNQTVEFRLRTGDGCWRHVEAIGNNLLDDPAIGGVVLTTRDITERKQAEEELRQSEQRFRALVQNTSDIISVMKDDGTVEFVSPAATRLLGWDERRGRFDPLHYVHPDDRDRVVASYRENTEGKPIEYRMRHADGSWRHLESVGTNLLDDPAVRGVVVNTRDITERKAGEEAQARRARAEQLVSAISRRVLTASAGDIDTVIEQSLGEVAGFLSAGATGLLQYSEDGSRTIRTHAWFDIGADDLGRFPAERPAATWFADGLRDVDHLVIDVDDLPAEGGHDREGLRAAGIETLAFLPIRSGGRVSGFVAVSWFEAVPDHVDTLLSTLRVLGDVFIAALDRTRIECERLEADEALRQSEERFRALVQNSSDMVTVLDADGMVQYTSPASRRILGLDENDQTGGLGFDRVHPDDLDAITRVFTEALQTPGPTRSVEVRLRHEDGSWRTIEAVGTNLLHDPAVEGLVVNGRDITERVRLEEHFRALVQNTSDMITVLDAEGRIVYASPAAEVVLGWSIPEWIGRQVFELLHPDDLERVGARLAEAVAEEGLTEPVEFRMRRADGTWCYIEGIGNSLFHDPAVNGIVVTARDVTDRKRLEAQLLQAQKMEAVGQLAGGVAHDFNNLLTAITGYTALLLDATVDGDPRRDDLEEIANAGARATKLVDQLLSFSRRKMVQPAELDLGEVVESMRSLVNRLLPADIEVVTELETGLDQIKADRSQVEQVLMNLVVNARDAMPDGGRLVIETIDAELDADSAAAAVGVVPGEYVVLAVSDDGIGMDVDTRARVFEPFFTTKDVGQGTGLGLSTVYGIVTQAGGQVTVYSEPGQGTTFRVYFPSVEAGASKASAEEATVATQAGGTETVLLVEDEAAVRALANQVLTRLGYTVLEAADGQDALEVADAHDGHLDLLLTDVVLPRASGIEVAEKLTADQPDLRVLFMSGYTETTIGRDGELDGHFLPKPFQPADLTRRVREILDG